MNAAYYRRSVSKDPSREVSREMQEAACRRMSGPGPLAEYVDWGMSGGTTRRPEYQRLRADIEAGRVGAIFAYSLSRLARSARELLDLIETCRERGVTITTDAEGTIGGRGAFAKFTTVILVALAEMERDLASERTLAGLAQWRTKHPGDKLGNDHYGDRPGEDAGAVLAAYREAKSYHGAARILTERGVPSRLGRQWGASTIRAILRHRAPELLPARKYGRAAPSRFALAGLLRCSCGATMAARRNHGRWAAYQCPKAQERPGHPRPFSIAESAVLPAVRAEVERLRLPVDAVELDGHDLGAERAALVAERSRLALAFARGGLPEATYIAEDVALEERIAELVERATFAGIAPVSPIRPEEWETWTPADLNAYVRSILRHVRLGPDMRPLPFRPEDWYRPELRGA